MKSTVRVAIRAGLLMKTRRRRRVSKIEGGFMNGIYAHTDVELVSLWRLALYKYNARATADACEREINRRIQAKGGLDAGSFFGTEIAELRGVEHEHARPCNGESQSDDGPHYGSRAYALGPSLSAERRSA